MKKTTTYYISSFSEPRFGTIWAAATKKGIALLTFGNTKNELLKSIPEDARVADGKTVLKSFFKFLNSYFKGKTKSYCSQIDVTGTKFQVSVWKKMKAIPYGTTFSYKRLAKAIGRPKAVRAVANACGANPLPIVIPCHRVIASDGSIGGFSCGIKIKKVLLSIETKNPSPRPSPRGRG